MPLITLHIRIHFPVEFDKPVHINVDEADKLQFTITETFSKATIDATFNKIWASYISGGTLDPSLRSIITSLCWVVHEINLHHLAEKTPYGLSSFELQPFIDKLPDVTEAELQFFNPRNLQPLEDDAELMPANRVDRPAFANVKGPLYEQELVDQVEALNLSPCLYYLLLIKKGERIRCSYANETLTITRFNERLFNTFHDPQVQKVVFMDATAHYSKLEAFIQRPVDVIAQRPSTKPARGYHPSGDGFSAKWERGF